MRDIVIVALLMIVICQYFFFDERLYQSVRNAEHEAFIAKLHCDFGRQESKP